jgi:thiamine biosynthesis lipoprotein
MKKWLLFVAVLGLSLAWGLLRERPVAAPGARPAETLVPPLYAAAADGSALVKRELVLMGSPFVLVADAPHDQALAAISAASERLRRLEAEISSWKPGSDVYRLNDNAGSFVTVGEDTLTLLQLAQQIHADTGGVFDISIGAVWDLYPFRQPNAPWPRAEQIAAALQHVGAQRIEIDAAGARARLPRGMRINLGGIGKGYAARIAIETLRGLGIQNAAVSAGGDLYLLGSKPGGPWQVRIANPRWEGQLIEQFTLRDRAVATSGDAARYIVREGKRYGHILDPRSGLPAQGTQSVTVICDDPTLADAYATAVFVLGPVEGMRWVEARAGVEALIVDAQGYVSRSRGWAAATGEAS